MAGTFIEGPPTVKIVDGLVHITPHDRHDEYVCLPSTFRTFIEKARRLLDQWEKDQRRPTPIRRRGG